MAKSKKLPLISVVICSYNGAGVIRDCLKSVQKQNWDGKLEIILVDDKSTDNTAEIAKAFRGVKVVRNQRNMGPAASRNVGIKKARGDIIAFTDDDCRPRSGWLKELYAGYENETIVGVGGSTPPHSDKTLLFRYTGKTNPLRPLELGIMRPRNPLVRLNDYLQGILGNGIEMKKDRKRVVYSLPSANLSFRKSVLNKVGGFDESFTFSGEDQDLCRRVNELFPAGILYAPKAKVLHQYKNSFKDMLRRSKAYGKGNALFGQKHPSVKAVIFPIPVALLIVSATALVLKPALLPLIIAMIPFLYFRWVREAIRLKTPEPLLYPYIQFLQELYGNIGFVNGMRQILRQKLQSLSSFRSYVSTPKGMTPYVATLLTLIVFNVLQVNSNPLQLVVSAVVISFIPGYLSLRALNLWTASLRSFLYAVSLSIALMLGVGIFINTLTVIYPTFVGMNTVSFVGGIDLLVIILLVIARRRSPLSTPIQLPQITFTKFLRTLSIALLPVVGAVAAVHLNNTGNNFLSMSTIVIVASMTSYLVYTSKKTGVYRTAFILYAAGLTIILLGALRGDTVSGTDISKELYLLQLMQHAGAWTPSLYNDAYNASLSINILPTLLSGVLHLSNQTIFQIVLPALYALVPVMAYALYKKTKFGFLGVLPALLIMAQPSFVTWSPIPIRQMVAIFFFAALILVAFDQKISRQYRQVLVFILGTSVILSHYSTAYITLGLIGLAFLLSVLSRFTLERTRQPKWRLITSQQPIALSTIIGLLIVAIIWFGPITHAGSNLSSRVNKAWSALADGSIDLFPAGAHAEKTSLAYQLGLEKGTTNQQELLDEYLDKTKDKYKGLYITPMDSSESYKPIVAETYKLPAKVPTVIVSAANFTDRALRQLVRVFLAIGICIFVWRTIRNRSIREEYIYGIAAAAILSLVIIVPHASIDYDVGRTTQHLLVLLALPILVGIRSTLKLLARTKFTAALNQRISGSALLLLMLFTTGFATQLTGGAEPTMLLNNSGNQYNQIYVHESDILATKWLRDNKDQSNLVYAGYFIGTRFYHAGMERPVVYNDILPWSIDSKAYVLRGQSELESNRATTYYRGAFLQYDYPSDALSNDKGITYSNGYSLIYK